MSINQSFYPIVYGCVLNSVDLTSTGSTMIVDTNPSFNTYIGISIIVQILSSNTFVAPASISIGTNSNDYNNILPITVLTGLSTIGNYIQIPILSLSSSVNPSTGIFVKVNTGATAVALTGQIFIIGFNT